MRRSLVMLALVSLIGFIDARAENAPAEKRLGAYVNAGFFGGGGTWLYEHVNESGTYETTFSFGAGIQCDIGHIYSCPVGVAIEVNDIQIRITEKGKPESSRGAAAASGHVVPVEFWGYVSSPGRFGPFVRAGVGALKTDVTETFTKAAWTDNIYEAWLFCYHCGGGLRFSATECLDFIGYVEGSGTTEEILARSEHGIAPTMGTGSYTTCGLRVVYRF